MNQSDQPLTTYMSVAALISEHRAAMDDTALAQALGYSQANVVALIRSGVMKLPVNKVQALAEALKIEPAIALEVVLREQAPQLLEVISEIFDPLKLTDTERRLVKHLRRCDPDGAGKHIVFDSPQILALVLA